MGPNWGPMSLISPLLKRVVYPGLAKVGYLRRRNGVGPAVVTYHGVLPQATGWSMQFSMVIW